LNNKIRIIGGQWRGRNLVFEPHPTLRPTPARLRETLFNWLQKDIIGSRCLDLYAGSGALGFEAASRGAKQVTLVDHHPQTCRLIKNNADKLSADQINLKQTDAFQFLASDSTRYDLVFLDPPFFKGLAQQTCHWLEDKDWLTKGAKIYVEVESSLILDDMPKHWQLIKAKKAGEVGYYLFERDIQSAS